MSSKYCMSCGGAHLPDAKFCSKCGNAFGSLKPTKTKGSSKPQKVSENQNDEEDISSDATHVPDIGQLEFEFEVAGHDQLHLGKMLKSIIESEEKKTE